MHPSREKPWQSPGVLSRQGISLKAAQDSLLSQTTKPKAKVFGDRTLDEIPNTRLFRLKQRTHPWSCQIAYLPGKTNHAADAASHNPSPGIVDSQISAEDYAEEVLVTVIT